MQLAFIASPPDELHHTTTSHHIAWPHNQPDCTITSHHRCVLLPRGCSAPCSGSCMRFAVVWCWWFGGSMVRFYWRWWWLQETKGKSAPWRRQELHRHKLTKGIFPPQSFPPGSPVYQYWNLQCQCHLCATWRCGGTAAIALPDRCVCAADRFLNHTSVAPGDCQMHRPWPMLGPEPPKTLHPKGFIALTVWLLRLLWLCAQARAADTVYWVPLPKYVVADTLWLDWQWLSLLIAFSSTCPQCVLAACFEARAC